MGPDQPMHRIPLPASRPAEQWRDQGLRGVRRLSNWTLAALVVGVGATSAAIARATQSTQSARSVTSVARTSTGTATGAAGGSVSAAARGSAPSLHAPVALTTPSGVVIQGGAAAGVTGRATSGVGVTATGRRVVYRGDT